jgi:DNA repair photolyase
MGLKTFNGKAIYNPSGKAGEYSYWACNFYNGCSGNCSYCYCKKGITSKVLGGNKPTLKKCFKDEQHAFDTFAKEMIQNKEDLREHGLFFSFTSDPFLKETIELNYAAINLCYHENINAKVLTKQTWWMNGDFRNDITNLPNNAAYGFTLTGHDELEIGCDFNQERISAMKRLHELGFKTWASIEPVIDIESSKQMIEQTFMFCDLYKVGLESGKKYDKILLREFIEYCTNRLRVYLKDSILKQAGIDRSELPVNCVNRDYNMFAKPNLPINFTKQEDLNINIKDTHIKKI